MNIALIATHFNTGGITTYLVNLGRGLARKGHGVVIVSAGGNGLELLHGSGVRHVAMDIRVKSEAHPKLWAAVPRLSRLVREAKIDILHANTRVTQVMAWAAGRRTGKPFVSTCHGFFKPRLFRRLFPCWGAGVIAVSAGVRGHLIDDFKVPPDHVRLIPNGIDLMQFPVADARKRADLRRQWNAGEGPVIGIIARLSSVKAIDVLIKAMPVVLTQVPGARLWIVGEGPERDSLQRLTRQFRLDEAVHFQPTVNRTADILPLFDVFVMPSLQEGLGLAVIEAQAAGVPVIASAVGGLPDLIADGTTGVLVPPGRSDALAAQIIALLQQPDRAQAMAAAARAQAEEKFAAPVMVDRTVEFYTHLAGAHHRGAGVK